MVNLPQITGIPFNGNQSDANGFAPIYDPIAIRFARKVNFAIGTVIAGVILIPFWMLSTGPISAVNANRVKGDILDTAVALLLNFFLPILFVMVAFYLIRRLTPRIGFNLPEAYRATTEALREWLPSAAGEFPRDKDDLGEAPKEDLSTVKDVFFHALAADSENTLYDGAKQIAREGKKVSLFSRDKHSSYLIFDRSERFYRFVTN